MSEEILGLIRYPSSIFGTTIRETLNFTEGHDEAIVKQKRPFMVLVDLQGTLLDIPGEEVRHRQALETAVYRISGLEATLPAERDGHTDYTLLAAAFDACKMSEFFTEADYEAIADAAAEEYKLSCPRHLEQYLRPGAISALNRLRCVPWASVVPLSGAIPAIVKTLITRANLETDLAVGFASFSGWQITRPDLVENARRRAGGASGLPWPKERTVVVSRSREDLAAAASTGVVTIAVGPELKDLIPMVEDFSQLPGLLRTMDWAML